MIAAGSVIAGKYRLEVPLGKGGMGAVWRATHIALGRAVAVKFVLASVSEAQVATHESIERFLREARSAAAVRHRNVVDVLDFGDENGRPYLVMECLDGESLGQRIERAPSASLAEIVDWIAQALGGLAAIHDAGLVHRDLKPANLFLARDADGVIAKVLDFGIARQTEGGGSTITHSMQTLGTPHYMSPEQVRSAKSVDARSDLYAIGVILYQALTGRLPFDGPSATAVIAAIVTDDPPRVASLRPDLPKAIGDLVHRAMSRDPSQRFADARTLRQALMRAAQGISPDRGGLPLTDVSAATLPMSSVPNGIASGPAVAPRPRRSRRGFLGIFGVLSTVLAVGLTGSGMWIATGSRSAENSVAAAVSPTGMQGSPAAAPMTAPTPPSSPASAGAGPARRLEGDSMGPAALDALAIRLRGLPDDLRGCARIAADGARWVALASEACTERGEDVIRALGVAAGDDAARDHALEPLLFRTLTRANVRAGPSAASQLRVSVPEGALIVGLIGSFDAAVSAASGRGSWTRVVAAEGAEGWIATGLLRPWEGCVPSADTIGAPRVIAAQARVHDGERETAGLVLYDPSTSSVTLVRIDARCAPAESFELPRPSDPIDDLIVTRTEEDGATIVVLGTRTVGTRDGTMTWRAYALGEDEPIWTIALRTDARLPDGARDAIDGPYTEGPDRTRGWWPLRTRVGRERTWWRWDGHTLIEQESAAARELR